MAAPLVSIRKNLELLQSIQSFFDRFPEALQQGTQTTSQELEDLPKLIKRSLPEFWKSALIQYPLTHLEIGVPNDFGQEELKGLKRTELPLMSIQVLSPLEIAENTIDSFPGHVLVKKNILSRNSYLCVAAETDGDMEGIFISTNEENPSPLLVFHDFGLTKKELIKHSDAISTSLSALFKEAFIKNENRVVSKDRLIRAKKLLLPFIDELAQSPLSTPNRIPETHSISEQEILDSIIESSTEVITEEELGSFMEALASIDVLSIPHKRQFWNRIHELYDVLGLHKGSLYFSEAHSMI